jgi:hypothetical protein
VGGGRGIEKKKKEREKVSLERNWKKFLTIFLRILSPFTEMEKCFIT